LFWIGAGASVWCDYPSWDKLAEIIHSDFLKYENKYDKKEALCLLGSKRYQDYFEICRIINEQRYFKTLADSFKPRQLTPVYERLICALSSIRPLNIITTNVDESLENKLADIVTVQRTDLERCIDLLNTEESFICKLHGSVSSIESLIFSKRDYLKLSEDKKYLERLKHILNETMIIFIGYGLSEDYVLDLLSSNNDFKNLFGDGPHFAILPDPDRRELPDSIEIIKYTSEPHRDHRSAIQVVEDIKIAHNEDQMIPISEYESRKSKNIMSAHLISDILPPGTWNSSENFKFVGDDGLERKGFIGNGIDNSEMPLTVSTALHDLIVGLICFDIVYVPLAALSRIHNLLGSDRFWELVINNCLKFIEWENNQAIVYPDTITVTGGELCSLAALKPNKEEATIQEKIRKQLLPMPGKEKEAENNFMLLEGKIEFIRNTIEPDIPALARSLLQRPSIRSIIGMSGGTSSTCLPSWMIFPVLRLANVIKIGSVCQLLGIASTKLEFGSAALASPAFAAAVGELFADEMTSYVITGNFDTNIGAYAGRDPSIFDAIIKFRDSQEAISFRKGILNQLSLCHGGDFVSSVNACLKSVVPIKILQAAHNQLSGLIMANNSASMLTRAVWNNADYAEKTIQLWKKRSARELKNYCEKNNVSSYDLCPCGSGEKLRFCFEEALKP